MRMRRLSLCLLPIIGVCSACSGGGSQQPAVETAKKSLTQGALFRNNEIVVLGHTRESRKVDIKAETHGRIVALSVRKGSHVKKAM